MGAYDRTGMSQEANDAYDRLSEAWGKPMTVTSAYRSPEHNTAVGGAKHSQHLSGNAFDFDTSGMSEAERIDFIRTGRGIAGMPGTGVYANSVHFDMGPNRSWGSDYTNSSVPDAYRDVTSSPVGSFADRKRANSNDIQTEMLNARGEAANAEQSMYTMFATPKQLEHMEKMEDFRPIQQPTTQGTDLKGANGSYQSVGGAGGDTLAGAAPESSLRPRARPASLMDVAPAPPPPKGEEVAPASNAQEKDPWNWKLSLFEGMEGVGVGLSQMSGGHDVDLGPTFARQGAGKIARRNATTQEHQEARLTSAQEYTQRQNAAKMQRDTAELARTEAGREQLSKLVYEKTQNADLAAAVLTNEKFAGQVGSQLAESFFPDAADNAVPMTPEGLDAAVELATEVYGPAYGKMIRENPDSDAASEMLQEVFKRTGQERTRTNVQDPYALLRAWNGQMSRLPNTPEGDVERAMYQRYVGQLEEAIGVGGQNGIDNVYEAFSEARKKFTDTSTKASLGSLADQTLANLKGSLKMGEISAESAAKIDQISTKAGFDSGELETKIAADMAAAKKKSAHDLTKQEKQAVIDTSLAQYSSQLNKEEIELRSGFSSGDLQTRIAADVESATVAAGRKLTAAEEQAELDKSIAEYGSALNRSEIETRAGFNMNELNARIQADIESATVQSGRKVSGDDAALIRSKALAQYNSDLNMEELAATAGFRREDLAERIRADIASGEVKFGRDMTALERKASADKSVTRYKAELDRDMKRTAGEKQVVENNKFVNSMLSHMPERPETEQARNLLKTMAQSPGFTPATIMDRYESFVDDEVKRIDKAEERVRSGKIASALRQGGASDEAVAAAEAGDISNAFALTIQDRKGYAQPGTMLARELAADPVAMAAYVEIQKARSNKNDPREVASIDVWKKRAVRASEAQESEQKRFTQAQEIYNVVMANGGLSTGLVASLTYPAQQLAHELFGRESGNIAQAELLKSLSNAMARGSRMPNEGTMSDYDAKMMQAMVANMANTRLGNLMISQIARHSAQRGVTKSRVIEGFFHDPANDLTSPGVMDKLDEQVKSAMDADQIGIPVLDNMSESDQYEDGMLLELSVGGEQAYVVNGEVDKNGMITVYFPDGSEKKYAKKER